MSCAGRSRVAVELVPGIPERAVPLIGRHDEMAALSQVLRAADRGRALAVVEGEAGIGKSRLIEATVAEARRDGTAVLATRAEELEAHRPFAPIVDAFGPEHFTAQLRDGELHADLAGARQFQVAEVVVERLEELCEPGPVLVAVEDLHWADPGTISVLARVAVEIGPLPVALVISTRRLPWCPELDRLLAVLADHGSTELRLGPLDETSCTQLAQALLDARPDADLTAQIRRAGGNPLFVCEVVGALLADGALVRREHEVRLAGSATVASLPVTVLRRLSFVPVEVLDLLRLASVLGSRFRARELALLAGRPMSALVPPLLSAQRAGVLAGEGERLVFRHELVRDALYDDIPLAVRRELHRELAAILVGAGEPTDRAAVHLVRATAPGDAAGTAAIIAAARELVGRAPTLACDLYHQAIELASDVVAVQDELLPELAQALVAAGRFEAGEQACRKALGVCRDPVLAGRLRLQLLLLLLRCGRTQEAVDEGEEGLACREMDARDRDRIRSLIAMALVYSGHGPVGGNAPQILASSDDELTRAFATHALALTAAGCGEFARAQELIEPVVRWADREGTSAAQDARPHMLSGLMLIRLDRFDEAETTIQRGRRAAESLGLVDALPVYHYQQALLDYSRGRLDDAVAELDTRDRLIEEVAVGWNPLAESLSALIALHRGDLLVADQRVTAARREVAAGESSFGADLMVLARCRLLEAAGEPEEALDVMAAFVDQTSAAGALAVLPTLGPDLARLAARAGAAARAAGLVAHLERIAKANPSAASLRAYALQVSGLLAGDRDAVCAARDLLRAGRLRLEAARAAEDAAALGSACADELLEDARTGYLRSGALRDLARVEATLRRRGRRPGVRGPRRRPTTGWEALTPTEVKVVRLVTERLTNQEIAQRMFLSRRTVQTHVSHALAKLGVDTRRDLAAEAARLAGWQLRIESVSQQARQPAVEPQVDPGDA